MNLGSVCGVIAQSERLPLAGRCDGSNSPESFIVRIADARIAWSSMSPSAPPATVQCHPVVFELWRHDRLEGIHARLEDRKVSHFELLGL